MEAAIESTNGTGAETVVKPLQPAPGAEDQKPTPPASDADAQKSDTETPEQQEAKRESRRARSNARKAQALAEARAEAKLLREERDRLTAKLEAKPTQEAGPQRDQFETLEAFTDARSQYIAEQAVEKKLVAEREERAKRESTSGATAGEAKVAKEWTERETAFQAANKDYQEAVAVYIEDEVNGLSDVARRSILESEMGPQVLYHLAKNPDEAERIAELSPVRQVAELGKLEVKLTPAKKASSAPAPITPVGSSSSTSSKRLSELSQDEFDKKRRAQIAARR